VQAPRQALLDLDAELDVVVGAFGQRGVEAVGAGLEALAVCAHPAEAGQDLRPLPSRRRLGGELLQQGACPLGVAAVEVALGRLDAAPARVVAGVGRGQPAGLLPQHGRGVGRAAGPRAAGGLVERGGDLGVGLLHGQRQVPPAFLGVVQDRGETGVQRPLARRRELREQHRREQRVRDPHLVGVDLHDAGVDRRLELLAAAHDPVDDRHGGTRQRRDHLEQLAGGWGQQRQAVADQLLEAGGDRQLLGGGGRVAAAGDGAGDLQREERVAAGGAVEQGQPPPGERREQVGDEQALECGGGKRPDRQVVEPALREGAIQAQRDRRRAVAPPCQQQAEPLVVQAAGDEGERARRGRVQALDVVDPDDCRALPRQRPQHAEQAERDRPRQRELLEGFRAQQRRLQRAPLRPRELGQDRLGDLGQQVPEGGVGELRLGVDRPARQHAVRTGGSGRQALLPQRGLADAGLALQHQRGRAGLDRVEELLDAAQLRLAADDPQARASSRHDHQS
jgi:hypothetical protein